MNTMSLVSQKNNNFFIGILSGTSMDSINTILMDYSADTNKIIATIKYPFNKSIKKTILNIIHSQQKTKLVDLEAIGTIDHQLGILFAKAINKLLTKARIPYKKITAIGSHGQNIWHSPHSKDPFTWQLGDPNIICARSKILTISDFRRKDMAYGGQGAPLAPLFHAAVFKNSQKTRAIINIGGISNITILPKNYHQLILGFDLGPGNCLMDEWVQKHFNLNYDNRGYIAATGSPIIKLLNLCLKDPYFRKPYPKSTGKEYFNLLWLNKKILSTKVTKFKNQDILATLLHLTATIISNQINNSKIKIEEVYLCGGGAYNISLLKLLKNNIKCPVLTTRALGFPPDWVEAALFAWLAKQTLEKKPGNLPSVTGANYATILGAIYLP